MTFEIIQLFLYQLILPAIVIILLWKGKFHSKLRWIIQLLFMVTYIAWVFQSGRWDWMGYYIRFIWIILSAIAIYRSWIHVKGMPFRSLADSKKKLTIGLEILIMLVFATYNVFIFSSYTVQDDGIELSFPLQDGTYYVGQGGSHVFMNYHNAYEDQQYALDIGKLNLLGMRAHGLYPNQLDKYAIYGDQLYSPCDAEVLEMRNNLADLTPPDSNPAQPEGNYVALACENTDAVVYIAHMQENSVIIDKGDTIAEGEQIGIVGNSGNTTAPHLHIHAEKDGVGIPIYFDGEFLVRNNLVR